MILPKEMSGILLQGGSTSPTPVELHHLVARSRGPYEGAKGDTLGRDEATGLAPFEVYSERSKV